MIELWTTYIQNRAQFLLVQDHVFQVEIYLLFLDEGAGAGGETLEVLVPAVLQDGRSGPWKKLVTLTKSTLSRSLRDNALVHGVLLNAVLEQLGVLSLRFEFDFFADVHLRLVRVGLGRCGEVLLGNVLCFKDK